jgi:hypothetical protein
LVEGLELDKAMQKLLKNPNFGLCSVQPALWNIVGSAGLAKL